MHYSLSNLPNVIQNFLTQLKKLYDLQLKLDIIAIANKTKLAI